MLACSRRSRARDSETSLNTTYSANRPDLRGTSLLAAGGYLLFVVYGSLVPLNFTPLPWETAWRDFLATPYLALGVGSRADWIANILLYIPLAYLLAAGLAMPGKSHSIRGLPAIAVFLACATLAVGIEFTQLYFPPRTVSLNDLIAEIIGAALGIALFGIWGGSLARLATEVKRGGMTAIRAMLVLYVLAYLTLSLFPYDFFVSIEELSKKFGSRSYGWIVAPLACGRLPVCLGKLAVEIIAAIPFGLLVGVSIGRTTRRAYATAMWTGLAVGLVVEVAQVFIASGVSQGASLLTRAAGAMIGVGLYRSARRQWLLAVQPYMMPLLLLACLPYLVALMWVNGWFRATWVGLTQAAAGLDQVHWLPFYYHYFTTETRALVSLMACIAMYSPVGIGFGLLGRECGRRDGGGSAMTASIIAAVLAGIIETGKLFVPGQHPDPTNVLIGAVAAAAGHRLTQQLCEWMSMAGETVPHVAAASTANPDSPSAAGFGAKVLGATALLLAVGLAADDPLPGSWLPIALVVYGLVLWRFPWVALPVVFASLPLANFAPRTGRLMLDEFDLVVLVTLGVGLCRPAANPGRIGLPLPFAAVASLVALSYLVSAGIGLLPLQPWDANAFSNYHSHYNALRVAKGALWAFSLLWLAAISMRPGADMRKLFTLGMVAGLAGTVAVIFWERVAFTGLFNFSHDYRVSGPFSALHIGGSTLETYLVAALPFALFAVVATRNAALRLGGLLLFGGGVYGVMVAYSRAGFAALVAVAALMFVAFVRHGLRHKLDRKVYVLVSLFVIGASVVAVPVLKGSFAQGRLAQSERDLQTRLSYWRNALAMMDDGWRTSLFGMGLGRFPETFFWRSTVGTRPGTYRFESENGNTFLRLGSGSPIFVDQIVALQPHSQYTLSVDVRRGHDGRGGNLSVPICQKRLLQSFQCEKLRIRLDDADGAWQHHEVAFDSKAIGAGPWYARRPVTLALNNPAGILDVDNVRLIGEDGRDLLTNGAFDHGSERWLFTVDDNWPWHVENFWLHIYFEQGWLGLLGMAALTVGALAAAVPAMWRGDLFAGTLTASMGGFLVVGTLNSPNDNPQLAFLFLFLCGFAAWSKMIAAPKSEVRT